jgi:SAM-dependent methyltransferase
MIHTNRVKNRQKWIWSKSFITDKYLWEGIEQAVAHVLLDYEITKPNVVDVGCGEKPYRDLFNECVYIGIDRSYEGADPDIIGDATSIPLSDCFADIIFTTQVIEHVSNHKAMLRECYRLLKPGGTIILTGPFYWPLHEEPYDFYRFSKYGFNSVFDEAGFCDIEVTADSGDWAQIFQSINLKLHGKIMLPFIIIFNILGVIFDRFDHSENSPINYIVVAKK